MSVTTIWEGAKFSLTAQTMVFLVLALIALVIEAIRLVFHRRKRKHASREAAQSDASAGMETSSVAASGEPKKLAAIAAALVHHERARVAGPSGGETGSGPWAPKPLQGKTSITGIKARRWSNG